MDVELVPSVFKGSGKDGDFAWMIDRPEYADALFVFNDNKEQWALNRQSGRVGRSDYGGACTKGGGNAVIRPYQCMNPPRAIGIPTGSKGCGYTALTNGVADLLDLAAQAIADLLATGRYKRLIYSAASPSGELGTGIFDVAADVKAYIVAELKGLALANSERVPGPR